MSNKQRQQAAPDFWTFPAPYYALRAGLRHTTGWLLITLFCMVPVFLHYQPLVDQAHRYTQAPVCTGPATVDCRRMLDVMVSQLRTEQYSTKSGGSYRYWVTIAVPQGKTAEYPVRRDFYTLLTVGTPLQAESWAGTITELIYTPTWREATAANPAQQADKASGWVLVFGGLLGGLMLRLAWLGGQMGYHHIRWVRRPRPAPPKRPTPAPVAVPVPAVAGTPTRRLRAQDVPRRARPIEHRTRRLATAPPLPRRVVR